MKFYNSRPIQCTLSISHDLEALLLTLKMAFIDFSQGLYEVLAPMQLLFPTYQNDCHIKCAHQKNSAFIGALDGNLDQAS